MRRPDATRKRSPILKRRSALDPNNAEALSNRGQIYRQTRKLDLALADYNRAIEIDDKNADAYLGRGLVYKASRQPL